MRPDQNPKCNEYAWRCLYGARKVQFHPGDNMRDYELKVTSEPERSTGARMSNLQLHWLEENLQMGPMCGEPVQEVLPHLRELFVDIKEGFTYKEEVTDKWEISNVGDCEDFALWFREHSFKYFRHQFRMTMCGLENKSVPWPPTPTQAKHDVIGILKARMAGHMVLTLDCIDGTIVIDHIHGVHPIWSDIWRNYYFICREDPHVSEWWELPDAGIYRRMVSLAVAMRHIHSQDVSVSLLNLIQGNVTH